MMNTCKTPLHASPYEEMTCPNLTQYDIFEGKLIIHLMVTMSIPKLDNYAQIMI